MNSYAFVTHALQAVERTDDHHHRGEHHRYAWMLFYKYSCICIYTHTLQAVERITVADITAISARSDASLVDRILKSDAEIFGSDRSGALKAWAEGYPDLAWVIKDVDKTKVKLYLRACVSMYIYIYIYMIYTRIHMYIRIKHIHAHVRTYIHATHCIHC
jgi:hypothetical protein